MKRLTPRTAALGLALTGAMALSAARAADSPEPPGSGSKQSDIGALTGLAVGAAAGGPVGALVGTAAGALIGDRYHRQAQSSAALAAELRHSEQQRADLAGAVARLDGSLSQARTRVDELAAEVRETDQLGLDVSFRTDDDSVAAAAMSPLLKLGALAASLPQAQLSVAGFTDPRGPDAYNQDLSLRRAQNVAAVLQSAGVPPERILVEAHGKSATGSADGDLDSYALERRVIVRMQLPASAELARRD